MMKRIIIVLGIILAIIYLANTPLEGSVILVSN